jgi:hypothetical protein
MSIFGGFFIGEKQPMTEHRGGSRLHGVLSDGYDLHIFLADFFTGENRPMTKQEQTGRAVSRGPSIWVDILFP